MLLPCGITGFDPVPEVGRVPSLRDFRADCWQIAITLNAKVENREPEPYTSFVSQMLIWPDTSVVVLLNNNYPVLAFCQPFKTGTLEFEFIDNAKVSELFVGVGNYEIWGKEILDLPVQNEMCKELGPSEKRRVDYFWSGRTRVGDVVFNHWD